MRSTRSGDSVLPPAGARRCEASHRGIEGEPRAQCAHVRRCKEEHTPTERQSWGLLNNSGFRMTGNNNSTPPQGLEDGHICCILLIRIVFYHESQNFSLHWLLTSISFSTLTLHVTCSRFCFYLLIFLTLFTHFHTHVQRHTHTRRDTCMISTQEEWRQPGTGNLVGSCRRKGCCSRQRPSTVKRIWTAAKGYVTT